MTRHIWLMTVGSDLKVTKVEPPGFGLTVTVTVRPGGGDLIYDGVWINGARSFDTYVLIDGVVSYHSPVESVAGQTFELHEARGGGQSL